MVKIYLRKSTYLPSIKIFGIGKKLADIRSKGTLSKWIDDKGFGFLTPEKGKKEIFVYISAFDRNIPRMPIVGDIIFYHVKIDEKGKSKAYDAVVEGMAPIVKKVPSRSEKHYKEHQKKVAASTCGENLF